MERLSYGATESAPKNKGTLDRENSLSQQSNNNLLPNISKINTANKEEQKA